MKRIGCWKYKNAAFLLVLLLAASVQALPLDLPGALREAVTHHPDVRARLNERQAASAQLEGAQWGRYPSLSAELQTQTGGPQTVAKIEQPLWTGGRITGQISVATANLGLANAAVSEAEQKILGAAATAFFEILRLESRLKAAVTNEAEHLRLQQIIQRRAQSEISPKTDETQADARLSQAVADRLQTQRQLEAARLALEQAMGRSSVGELAAPPAVNLSQWAESSLLEAALAYAPERKRLLMQVETNEAQIALASAQIMPTLVAGYQSQLGTLLTGQERSRMYLGVQFQSGAGLSSLSAVQVAIARKLAAQDAIETHDRQLTQTVRSTWSESKALAAQLAPVRALLTGSDEIVASYLRQFQVGRKNWLDVLNAQREKTQAYNSLADIEYPLLLSQVRLLIAAGQLNAAQLELPHVK